MTSLYIDTNIIMDAVEGRFNLVNKDIGTPAFRLFDAAVSCKYDLIISTFTLYELRKKYEGNLTFFFAWIKKKTTIIEHTEQDEEKARMLKEDNFDDALHVVLAEKSNADYIITRNTKDFNKIPTNIPIRIPEYLI